MKSLSTFLAAVDNDLTQRSVDLVRHRTARWSAALLAHSGDSQWWIIAGVLLWWLGIGHLSETGKQICILTVITGISSGVLKQLFRRTRPADSTHLLYLSFDRHSFPSGHAVRVGALAVLLSTKLPVWGALISVVWAILVGFCRIALGAHYASDIVAGLLLGALIGILLLMFWN